MRRLRGSGRGALRDQGLLQRLVPCAVIGLAAAYATGRLASSWLFEVRATDPLILVASLALVLVSALVATVIPARRAARIDPVVALRLD